MNLLTLQPRKVQGSLRGKSMFLYAEGGVGKSTFFNNIKVDGKPTLFAATEIGYQAIDGIVAQDINNYNDAQDFLKELKKPAVREQFGAVCIDNLDNLILFFQDKIIKDARIAEIARVEKKNAKGGNETPRTIKYLEDIEFRLGFDKLLSEVTSYLNEITRLGYFIGATLYQSVKTDRVGKVERSFYSPAAPNEKILAFLKRLPDMFGFARVNEKGDRELNFEPTPEFYAKNRFTVLQKNGLPFDGAKFQEMFLTLVGDNYEKEDDSKYSTFAELKDEFDTKVKKQMSDLSGEELDSFKERLTKVCHDVLGPEGKVSQLSDNFSDIAAYKTLIEKLDDLINT